MSEESISNTKHFSPHASLAVIGLKLQELKLFEIISRTVKLFYV